MTMLVIATLAFLATHFVASTPLRPALVNAMGEWPYRGAYSTVALITLGWMIWAYAGAPREQLWTGFREIAVVLMPFAFVLLACLAPAAADAQSAIPRSAPRSAHPRTPRAASSASRATRSCGASCCGRRRTSSRAAT